MQHLDAPPFCDGDMYAPTIPQDLSPTVWISWPSLKTARNFPPMHKMA